MKIESVTLREIHMPLVHFFETSFGRVYGRRILLVTVEADGVRGWGECVAGEDPFYSPEWTETAWPTIKQYLAPLLLQSALDAGRDCGARFARVRGHRRGKAALKTQCGTRKRGRNNCRSGSCWEERGARSRAAFRSAFRTRQNNFFRRSKLSWRRDTVGSRSR